MESPSLSGITYSCQRTTAPETPHGTFTELDDAALAWVSDRWEGVHSATVKGCPYARVSGPSSSASLLLYQRLITQLTEISISTGRLLVRETYAY